MPPDELKDVRGMLGRIHALEKELLDCQWATGPDWGRSCPCCGSHKSAGVHWPTCHIAALLNLTTGPDPVAFTKARAK